MSSAQFIVLLHRGLIGILSVALLVAPVLLALRVDLDSTDPHE